MADVPTPTASRLQKPSWKDTRLVIGVLLVLAAVVLGSLTVGAADNRVPMYAAASPLVPGQPLAAERLTRVDVQLGEKASGYLSAASPLPAGAYVLREVRPGELVPLSAIGGQGDVAVQPLTLVVDASSAAPLVVGSVVDVYVNPVAADGDAAGRDFAGAELALEGVSVAGLPRSQGALGGSRADQAVQVMAPKGSDPRPHRPGRPRGPRHPRPRPRFAPRERPVSRTVLTAVSHRWESELVTALEASASLTVVRRCADLADLLAAASAGLADVAIVSADLRSLDRAALHHLASHSVLVAGAIEPGDEPGERRLRQLGIDVVVHSDAATHELEEALEQLDTLTGPATLPFGEAPAAQRGLGARDARAMARAGSRSRTRG